MTGRVNPLPGLTGLGRAALPGLIAESQNSLGVIGSNGGIITSIRWNPSDKAASTTLSNGNRTAISSSGTAGVRSTAALSGKKYIEIVVESPGPASGNAYFYAGVVNASASLTAASGGSRNLGMQAFNITGDQSLMFPRSGQVSGTTYWAPGAQAYLLISAGTTIRIAIDCNEGKFWMGVNSGWFIGEPATGLEPAITGLSSDTWYLYALMVNDDVNPKLTIPTSTKYTAPLGFDVA